jgi:protein phosphatase
MNDLVVIILIGPPGSGKTTWGKFYAEKNGIVRICPDEIRGKIGIDENDQSVSYAAFGIAYSTMENVLAQDKSVMIDATNMYRKTRKRFLKIARAHGAQTMAVVFEVDKKTLMERNKNRGKAGGRNVGETIIDDMLSRYQRPENTEFDVIKFI